MMNVFSTVSSDAIIRSRDKLRSFQRLSKGGIDMPKTVFTNYSKDVEEVIEYVGRTPVVIKLLEGTQGLGVVLLKVKMLPNLYWRPLVCKLGLLHKNIAEAKGIDVRAFIVDGQVIGAMKELENLENFVLICTVVELLNTTECLNPNSKLPSNRHDN